MANLPDAVKGSILQSGTEAFANVAVAIPSDIDFESVSKRQEQEYGKSFTEAYISPNAGEAVRKMQRKRNESIIQLNRTRWNVVSIVNTMPYPLNVDGVLHNRLRGPDGNQVPPCPIGQLFIRTVIREPQWSVREEPAGQDGVENFTPVFHLPEELADDYIQQFVNSKRWGVIVYNGDRDPTSDQGLLKKLNEAEEATIEYLRGEVQYAEGLWSDPIRRKEVTNHYRDAAQVLFHKKILKHLPEWVIASAPGVRQSIDPCPGCGDVPERKSAMCKECYYVYNPLHAYKSTLIEYGHISMNRMTAEEWEEANQIEQERQESRQLGGTKPKKAKTT